MQKKCFQAMQNRQNFGVDDEDDVYISPIVCRSYMCRCIECLTGSDIVSVDRARVKKLRFV